MQVYTYSEARQKLSMILDQAENSRKVLIRRKDGRTFALVPEQIASSPLVEVQSDGRIKNWARISEVGKYFDRSFYNGQPVQWIDFNRQEREDWL